MRRGVHYAVRPDLIRPMTMQAPQETDDALEMATAPDEAKAHDDAQACEMALPVAQ